MPVEIASKASDGVHKTLCMIEIDKPGQVVFDETLLECKCSTSPDHIVSDSRER